MPVSSVSKPIAPLRTRRAAIAVALLMLALAAAVSVATFSRKDFATAVDDAGRAGLSNIKTVAAMLADRSPGERPGGALASLKHKRLPTLHERALPKVRQPTSHLAAIVGAPPVPPVETPPATPLYSMVAGPPVVLPPQSVVSGGPPGGGPPGSDIPPQGGGGGVVVPPVTQSTPNIPVTPVTPAVPEPSTWAMMLVGFALVGWATRRDTRSAGQTAAA